MTTVSGNGDSVLAVRVDGSVWAWGDNGTGQLGLPSVVATPLPTPVTGLSSVVATASGQTTGYALGSDGTVWATGVERQGPARRWHDELSAVFSPVRASGRPRPSPRPSALPTRSFATARSGPGATTATVPAGRRSDRRLFRPPRPGDGDLGATAIATTYQSGYALLGDGTVRAWGGGSGGALGNGSVVERAAARRRRGPGRRARTGDERGRDGYALKRDGTVWAWGPNGEGTIGDGTTTDRHVPTQAPAATGAVSLGVFGGAYAVMPDGPCAAGARTTKAPWGWATPTCGVAHRRARCQRGGLHLRLGGDRLRGRRQRLSQPATSNQTVLPYGSSRTPQLVASCATIAMPRPSSASVSWSSRCG